MSEAGPKAPDPKVVHRHRREGTVLAAGVGLLALCVALLEEKRSQVPGWEADLFSRVNGWPGVLEPFFVMIMQAGRFWAIPVVCTILLVAHLPRAAISVGFAGLLAWGGSRLVKEIIGRERPVALLEGVQVREGVIEGLGFVSGHSATSFAIATALVPWLPPRWRWAPLVIASCVGVARVYVGVHLPLDVIGGAGLGIACGALAGWLFGTPARAEAFQDPPRAGDRHTR